MSNISKNDKGKIVFGNNCTDCFACLHWCPNAAISAGLIKMTPEKQYHHPETDVSFLIKPDKTDKNN